MFPVDFNRRPSSDLRLFYDFLQFPYGFPKGLLCFRLVLIVGLGPIFVYLMISDGFVWISYGFVWISYSFDMLRVDLNRRPSPNLRLSYVRLWFSFGFPMFLICFQLILIVGSRPIFGYFYDFISFSDGFIMVLLCFHSISIVCPRPIFGYLMISHGFPLNFYGFAVFLVNCNRWPSPDLRLSYVFI